ncbi:MAG: triose-phosphate isomerase [Patescibacteria group bacterium]|jgi:triosephosphate isomerase
MKTIIANWKMQLSLKESLELAKQAAKKIKGKNKVVLCPDFLALPFVGPILKGTGLDLGAQNSAMVSRGAYTGEVSPLNLKALGVKYVILGHSERREHLHENSNIINLKIKAALENGLIPVLCVGEKLEIRKNGETEEYLDLEIRHALKGVKIKKATDLIIAYEPIWAISTNKKARPMSAAEAESIHQFIAAKAVKILKQPVAVLYGGSVNAANAGEYLSQKNITGLLVGGASLKIKDFSYICSL